MKKYMVEHIGNHYFVMATDENDAINTLFMKYNISFDFCLNTNHVKIVELTDDLFIEKDDKIPTLTKTIQLDNVNFIVDTISISEKALFINNIKYKLKDVHQYLSFIDIEKVMTSNNILSFDV